LGGTLSGQSRERRQAQERKDPQKGVYGCVAAYGQGAWAVSTKKNNYLSALYRPAGSAKRIERATIAVAHKLLVIAYHILRDGTCYSDLGADYFDRLNQKACAGV